ncbi:nuclear factor Y, subunit B6 [Trifolium repens]|nr:nuclear factor Y, subunit B6 [Trifolium repens]
MRRALPLNAKIKNSAKEWIQWCAYEFMGIITTEANERCKAEHRKIITADDLIWAMERFGFDDYVRPLKLYLKNYRDHKNQTYAFGFNNNGFDASGSNNDNVNGQH